MVFSARQDCLAIVLVVAVLAQAVRGLHVTGYNTGNYFSYFTVISNFIAAGALLVSAYVVWARKQSRAIDYIRGAAVLYMVLTCLGYTVAATAREFTLLPGIIVIIPWANNIIHFIGPLLVVSDWLIDRPTHPLRFRPTFYWLAFPFAYVIFSLARGHLTGWYPYPFLDVQRYSFGVVALGCLVTFGLIVALGAGVMRLANMLFNSRH